MLRFFHDVLEIIKLDISSNTFFIELCGIALSDNLANFDHFFASFFVFFKASYLSNISNKELRSFCDLSDFRKSVFILSESTLLLFLRVKIMG